ncbi:MAG: LemA family protein [Alphaproteobacteria bacterium]|nr:LemA family protein [Alphaproteobacteria bacterium]
MTILLWVVWAVTFCLFLALAIQRIHAGAVRTMAALNRRCQGAFLDLDTHLKRRQNLLPALLSLARDTGLDNRDLVANLNDASAHAASVPPELRLHAELGLSPLIQNLLSALEHCPAIHVAPKFAGLHRQLVDCERRITTARLLHNRAIEKYYSAAREFPACYIAQELRMPGAMRAAPEQVRVDDPVVVISF